MNAWEYFQHSVGNRDFVFKDILGKFSGPLKICEIGCARSPKTEARRGDGWSSFHWLDYVVRNGGYVDIVDLDEANLTRCRDLLYSRFENPADLVKYAGFYHRDGASFLRGALAYNSYDLFFLDSGDNPDLTRSQFEILPPGSKVLIDDFHAKGKTVRQNYPNFRRYWWHVQRGEHPEMAAYGFDNQEIQCPHLE